MHPILLKIGSFTIYTYGFFIALGILAGIFVVRREAARVGENPDKVMDLCFYLVISGVIGSRIFYVATTPAMFVDNPLDLHHSPIGHNILGVVPVEQANDKVHQRKDGQQQQNQNDVAIHRSPEK